jgi:hypothetical protein
MVENVIIVVQKLQLLKVVILWITTVVHFYSTKIQESTTVPQKVQL